MMLNGDQRMTEASKAKLLPVIENQKQVAEKAISFLSAGEERKEKDSEG